jgi:hypothetical protein
MRTRCRALPGGASARPRVLAYPLPYLFPTRAEFVRGVGKKAGHSRIAAFPVVLLLEDLHWADAPSMDLIRHLGQHIRTQRLLVLATARHEEQELKFR